MRAARPSASLASAATRRSSLPRKWRYKVPSATPACAATSRSFTASKPPSSARATAVATIRFVRSSTPGELAFPGAARRSLARLGRGRSVAGIDETAVRDAGVVRGFLEVGDPVLRGGELL